MVDLHLRQLRIFISVANTGNLGTSAKDLFITRGAVSQAIKALENILSVQVFDRIGQRLVLNGHGHQLRPLAEDMLARQQAIACLFSKANTISNLRLGASRTIGNYLLPALLADETELPTVSLANSQQLQQQLLNYDLDLALIESESINAELLHHRWLEDEMLVICACAHPLAGKKVPWQALNEQPWVLRESHSGSREQFDHFLAPKLDDYRVALEFTSLEAVIHAAAAGIGLSLVSRLACRSFLQMGKIAQISLPQKIERRFHIVYPAANKPLPQVQYFVNKLIGS